MTAYQDTVKWRKKAKNKKYPAKFMKQQRIYWRQRYLKREVKYGDIPKGYRYFVNSLET